MTSPAEPPGEPPMHSGADFGAPSPSAMLADYAPSPSTSQSALGRAAQMRVQALLRRLLSAPPTSTTGGRQTATTKADAELEAWRRSRIDTLRVLRKTLRELDHQLSWIGQVDLLETMERLLREDLDAHRPPDQLDWRLVHDCSQLLIESLPRLAHPLDEQTLEGLLPMVVQNLGHERSEVRRASLLLLNMLLNERPQHFTLILRLFIEFGLSNYCNEQAQRGAILSLPLLMSERVVRREDLQPLVSCLGELLVESNESLFYSLYLALQRLHLVLGDERFGAYLRRCEPEAMHLYKQAASRNNSLVASSVTASHDITRQEHLRSSTSLEGNREAQTSSPTEQAAQESQQHVTFEDDQSTRATAASVEANDQNHQSKWQNESPAESSGNHQAATGPTNSDDEAASAPISMQSSSSSSSSSSPSSPQLCENKRKQSASNNNISHNNRLFSADSVSSTCSSDAHLVDPRHYMSRAALHGRPMDDYEQIHHVDHSNVASLAINDMGLVCNTPTVELGPSGCVSVDVRGDGDGDSSASERTHADQFVASGGGEMKFGVFPRHLVRIVLGAAPRHADRLEAMQELMCIVRESPVNHLAILMSYFDSFLEQFLARLVQPNADYKLQLVAVDMLETIVVKTKVSTMQFVRPIVGLLVKTLADSRAQQLFRAQTCRVLHKMMAYLPPQHVIDALFEHKHSRNALVREETINRVTGAVLEYERTEFNLTKLCYHVLPMLADSHSNVRLAALECIATLAHALGPERIGSLLTAAEAVQTGCDYEGLLDAVCARLRRRALPRCNPADGSIRHVLRPLLSSSAASTADAREQHLTLSADLRWVLEAPSRHQHSPGPFYRPHHLQQEIPKQAAEPEHQHHRLGAYSPPSAGARRRRSSVGLIGLVGGEHEESASGERHHHQHHHHQHHHRQQSFHDEPQRDSSVAERGPNPGAAEKPIKISQQQKHHSKSTASETNSKPLLSHRRKSCDTRTNKANSETTSTNNANDQVPPMQAEKRASSERRRSSCCPTVARDSRDSGLSKEQPQQQQHPFGQLSSMPMRSNSQDSITSTDTNKVLFQYYLGKFKQSLAEVSLAHQPAAVLPSDSIIYSDIDQAFELSRHQSRYQQTSFDSDADNNDNHQRRQRDATGAKPKQVGRQAVPKNSIGPEHEVRNVDSQVGGADQRHKQQQQQQQQATLRRRTTDSSDAGRQGSPDGRSSVSSGESPQTVMEACKAPSEQPQQQRKRSSTSKPEASSGGGSRQSSRAPSRQQSQEAMAAAAAAAGEEINLRRASVANPRQQSSSRRSLVRQEASAAVTSEASANEPALSRSTSSATNASSANGHDDAVGVQADEQTAAAAVVGRRPSRQTTAATNARASGEQECEAARESRRRASRSQPPAARQRTVQQQQQAHDEIAHRRATSRMSVNRNADSGDHLMQTNEQQAAMASERNHHRRAISVSPSLAHNVNIRHILENVAQIDGPFADAQLAFKVALDAIEAPSWSTKVEGIMALIRLANFHQPVIIESGHLHELVCRLADETRNLRSTVSRSAIYALGDMCAKLRRAMEPQLELVVQALLRKSIENTAFIRDDIRRSLGQMVDAMTSWRLAGALINHGATHKSVHVRRMASQFVAQLVERMGAAKCLVGAKEISSLLIPAAAKFAQDNSPFTRFYGRQILAKLMQHGSFDRLLRQNLTPNLYRSTLGIIESVKRRGPGELPAEN